MIQKQYVKKPIIIEAVDVEDLMDLRHKAEGFYLVPDWIHERVKSGDMKFDGDKIRIKTLEGEQTATSDDFLIRGIKGEVYPCKRDIFYATYEEVISE